MTYELIETSTEDGRPVELYEFLRGAEAFRFTSADSDQEYLTNTYTAIAIERSAIGQTDKFEKSGINIEFARDDSFASAFLAYSPDSPTTLTIFREHLSDVDSEFITYWKGRVGAVSATGSRVRLECESVFSSLNRQGLRAKHQRMCRHILYDVNCTQVPADHVVPSVAFNVSGNTFDFATATDATNPQLIAYYSGENLTAGTLTDDSGNGNNGTATDVTQVASFVGNGLSFNGTTSQVSTPIVLPATDDFAVSFAVSSTDTDGAIISNDSGQSGGLQIKLGTSSFVQVLFETMTLTSTTPVTDADNFVVHVERSGTAWRLVVNDTEEDTGTESSAVDTAVFYLGANPDGSSRYAGEIDQIRFYDTIQTADAVSYLSTEDTNVTLLSDWFLAGMAEVSTGAKRFIKVQANPTLTISSPFESLAENESINLYPGCQHRFIEDCTDKFANEDNYGGHPYRPTDDGPFTGRSIV